MKKEIEMFTNFFFNWVFKSHVSKSLFMVGVVAIYFLFDLHIFSYGLEKYIIWSFIFITFAIFSFFLYKLKFCFTDFLSMFLICTLFVYYVCKTFYLRLFSLNHNLLYNVLCFFLLFYKKRVTFLIVGLYLISGFFDFFWILFCIFFLLYFLFYYVTLKLVFFLFSYFYFFFIFFIFFLFFFWVYFLFFFCSKKKKLNFFFLVFFFIFCLFFFCFFLFFSQKFLYSSPLLFTKFENFFMEIKKLFFVNYVFSETSIRLFVLNLKFYNSLIFLGKCYIFSFLFIYLFIYWKPFLIARFCRKIKVKFYRLFNYLFKKYIYYYFFLLFDLFFNLYILAKKKLLLRLVNYNKLLRESGIGLLFIRFWEKLIEYHPLFAFLIAPTFSFFCFYPLKKKDFDEGLWELISVMNESIVKFEDSSQPRTGSLFIYPWWYSLSFFYFTLFHYAYVFIDLSFLINLPKDTWGLALFYANDPQIFNLVYDDLISIFNSYDHDSTKMQHAFFKSEYYHANLDFSTACFKDFVWTFFPCWDLFVTVSINFWVPAVVGTASKIFGTSTVFTPIDLLLSGYFTYHTIYGLQEGTVPVWLYTCGLFMPAASTTVAVKAGIGILGICSMAVFSTLILLPPAADWCTCLFFSALNGWGF